jgi:hypothetical protein
MRNAMELGLQYDFLWEIGKKGLILQLSAAIWRLFISNLKALIDA